jgi:hypothetical protein
MSIFDTPRASKSQTNCSKYDSPHAIDRGRGKPDVPIIPAGWGNDEDRISALCSELV